VVVIFVTNVEVLTNIYFHKEDFLYWEPEGSTKIYFLKTLMVEFTLVELFLNTKGFV
jgi:hypothetical protein